MPTWPAIVVTMPCGVTRRMVWFPASATMTLPSRGSTATPFGVSKRAALPVPSCEPAAPVVTTPPGVIFFSTFVASVT